MTIYIVKWVKEDDVQPNKFYAYSSLATAKIKHREIRACMKPGYPGNTDYDIEPENEAITKHVVKTQEEVIGLINSLNT